MVHNIPGKKKYFYPVDYELALRWRYCVTIIGCNFVWKSKLQLPDTGTRVLDNTRPFLHSSIVSFWITPARSKMFQYSPILGRSSIWVLKYTFSLCFKWSVASNIDIIQWTLVYLFIHTHLMTSRWHHQVLGEILFFW